MSKKMSSTLCKYKRRLTNAPATRNETLSTTTTSPELSTPTSPITADLYTALDGRSTHPKTIAIVKQHLYYQQQAAAASGSPTAKPKKFRHRRIASGSGTHNYLAASSSPGAFTTSGSSPKSSPVRDRRYQSEPEVARPAVHMVDTQTQTDQQAMMDMSETDASPSPFVASRELAMCLRDSGRGRSIEDLNAATSTAAESKRHSQRRSKRHSHQASVEVMSPVVATTTTPSTADDDEDDDVRLVASPNGNSEELTYLDACSGSDRDPLDAEDVMNSNERLDTRTPVDDDHLERLGRRVSEFFTENRHSIQSVASGSDNGNIGGVVEATTTTSADAADVDLVDAMSFVDGVVSKTAGAGGKVRRGFVSVSGDGGEVTVCRMSDDMCGNDSWTDEEGEDPDNLYLGLRRKR